MRVLELANHTAIVHGRDGYFMVNPNDQYIAQSLIHYGEYNGDEAKMLHGLVKPGQCVVEVGANIGSHTIGLARAVGAGGKVIAYEPQRQCFALLSAQVALNQLNHVWAYQVGVGEGAATLYLDLPDYSKNGNFGGVSLRAEAGAQREPVQVVNLDSHLAGEKIHLIKIDVEGMEQAVLAGARQLISAQRPILYVENDRVEKSVALLSLIFDLGYQVWWHIPPLYSAQNFFMNPQNIFGGVASFNVLCIHQSQKANVTGLTPIRTPTDPHPLRKA